MSELSLQEFAGSGAQQAQDGSGISLHEFAGTRPPETESPFPPAPLPPTIDPRFYAKPTPGQVVFDEYLKQGGAALAGMPGDLWNLAMTPGRYFARGMNYLMPGPADQHEAHPFPTSAEIYAGNKENEAKTPAGQVGGEALKGAVSNSIYGPIGAALGAAGGATGQALSYLGVPKVIGNLLPYLGYGGVTALRGAPEKTVNEALSGLSDEKRGAALDLFNKAQEMGAPITLAEAVAQTAGQTRLQPIQRVIENSRGGSPIMNEFLEGRPAGVRQAFGENANAIAPQPADTANLAPRVQNAAEQTVIDANRARSQQTKLLYTLASYDRVPPDQVENVLTKIDGMIAEDKSGLLAGPLGDLRDRLTQVPAQAGSAATPTRYVNGQVQWGTPAQQALPRVPVTDIGTLDRVRKYFRDRMDLPAFAENAIDKETGSKVGGLLDQLDTAMEGASPNYSAAKQLHKDITNTTVAPLERSPTGQIAGISNPEGESGFGQVAAKLFPQDPKTLTPDAITKTIQELSARDPTAARDFTRQFLQSELDRTAKAGLYSGSRFASAVADNPQQAVNLEAAIKALPNGQQAWQGFRNMLDVFEAQGKRIPTGSQTEPGQQIAKELSGEGKLFGLGHLSEPLRSIHDWWEMFRYGKNSAEMARILTDPARVEQALGLRLYDPGSPQARAILSGITQTGRALPQSIP